MIGTGHVMRCLTLAKELSNSGVNCQFICRAHNGNLIERIKQEGFKVHALPLRNIEQVEETTSVATNRQYADWLGVDQKKDSEDTIACLRETIPDWLIVDHYAIDIDWEKRFRGHCRKMMVIDDLANRKHDCDLLLDQNFGRSNKMYSDLVPENCTVFTGSKYALLRSEFSLHREASLARRNNRTIKNVLISMGGIDSNNTTGKVLAALKNSELPADCAITVVMGKNSPAKHLVQSEASDMPWVTDVLFDVNNMAELMTKSDLAIGAAGSTAWERCCLGLPTVILVLAQNQQASASALERSGAAIVIQNEDALEIEMAHAIHYLMQDSTLSKMSIAAQGLTDGTGARIIAELLLDSGFVYDKQ